MIGGQMQSYPRNDLTCWSLYTVDRIGTAKVWDMFDINMQQKFIFRGSIRLSRGSELSRGISINTWASTGQSRLELSDRTRYPMPGSIVVDGPSSLTVQSRSENVTNAIILAQLHRGPPRGEQWIWGLLDDGGNNKGRSCWCSQNSEQLLLYCIDRTWFDHMLLESEIHNKKKKIIHGVWGLALSAGLLVVHGSVSQIRQGSVVRRGGERTERLGRLRFASREKFLNNGFNHYILVDRLLHNVW